MPHFSVISGDQPRLFKSNTPVVEALLGSEAITPVNRYISQSFIMENLSMPAYISGWLFFTHNNRGNAPRAYVCPVLPYISFSKSMPISTSCLNSAPLRESTFAQAHISLPSLL
jgi:hypothetical protein